MTKLGLSAEERFWLHVDKDGPTPAHRPWLGPCYLWTGGTTGAGYGAFGYGKPMKTGAAHRFAWELEDGPIPEGLEVCHHCDNPPCVRRDGHLFLATHLHNVRDCIQKGRAYRGKRKLSEVEVKEIREWHVQGETMRALGARFGVSSGHISRIVNGQAWVAL